MYLFELILLFLLLFKKQNFAPHATLHIYREKNINVLTLNKQTKTNINASAYHVASVLPPPPSPDCDPKTRSVKVYKYLHFRHYYLQNMKWLKLWDLLPFPFLKLEVLLAPLPKTDMHV